MFMIKKYSPLVLFISAIIVFPIKANATEEKDILVSLPRLSLDASLVVSKAAIEACRKEGYQVAVTIVNREGVEQVSIRDTIAPQTALQISRQKAYTAANFSTATSSLKSRSNTPIGFVDGIIMAPGGLPITSNGMLVGAIGVSGAPSGEIDEKCAQLGIDKIKEELEFFSI